MSTEPATDNVRQAVPFFSISSMEASVTFYVQGLGFEMTNEWTDDGKLRWCWLELGGAAVMLQEFKREGPDSWVAASPVGVGVSVYFICRDALALYRSFSAKATFTTISSSMFRATVHSPLADGSSNLTGDMYSLATRNLERRAGVRSESYPTFSNSCSSHAS